MKKDSLWKNTVDNDVSKQTLDGNIETDILIIGAGISGMSIGLDLLEKKQEFVVVEMNEVGSGVTSRSTGKLSYAQGSIYNKITTNYNSDMAYKYYKSQVFAIKKAQIIIKKYDINCDLELVPSHIFTNNANDITAIKKEEAFYEKYKIKYKQIKKLPNNYPVVYGIELSDTAHFNPLKYVLGLKKILEKNNKKIYENTKVYKLEKSGDKYIVLTSRGNITANKVVVATQYPFFILPSCIPFKTYIERSYVLASKQKTEPLSVITPNKPIISMRNYKDEYLIFSSNSHSSSEHINYKKQFEELETKYQKQFRGKIDYLWSTHDVMTNDGIPYIGQVKNEKIYIATGYNKWGMTNSILSGTIISEYLINKKNEYSDVFSLNRPFSLPRTLTAITNNLKTACIFIKTKLVKNHKFYEYAEVKNIDGVCVGIYHTKDKDYKVKNVCPHMKCSLVFNELEHVWECPCHGSSFDIEGNVLTGPSTYSIKLDD